MKEKITGFEDLRVWQDGMRLVEKTYAICIELPKAETYGLVSQMKRAAVSVPSNIAEGSERNGTKELIQFLYIARGSLAELRTQLILAEQLKFVDSTKNAQEDCKNLSRALVNLISSLRRD